MVQIHSPRPLTLEQHRISYPVFFCVYRQFLFVGNLPSALLAAQATPRVAQCTMPDFPQLVGCFLSTTEDFEG
jgi:hypothetical protein